MVVGHAGTLGLELVGACEVFQLANFWQIERGRPPVYEVQVMSLDGEPLPLFAGVEISVSASLRGYRGPVDTLVIAGGPRALEEDSSHDLIEAVRQVAQRARRVVSLCTGAFILAGTGLLDGKRATTHWHFGDDLAARYPSVVVDTDPIFVRDGSVWTSAGITAALNALLALIEDDEGVEASRWIARVLVVFLRRPGNQAQFSTQLSGQLADRRPIRDLQQFIVNHPEADLSIEAMAHGLNMSPRHFTRVFITETGTPPGRYVEQVRIERARRRLEESELPVEKIAAECGFGTVGNFRRTFVRIVGVSPMKYRKNFAPVLRNSS